MTADLLARAAGLRLGLECGRVRWRSRHPPSADLLVNLLPNREVVATPLAAADAVEAVLWQDAFAERAAVLEYDAGMARAAADAAADALLSCTGPEPKLARDCGTFSVSARRFKDPSLSLPQGTPPTDPCNNVAG